MAERQAPSDGAILPDHRDRAVPERSEPVFEYCPDALANAG